MENTSFESIGLTENILRGIYANGFETPSRIQAEAIPLIIDGCDLLAQSQSGTGKTGAFIIGVLQRMTVRAVNTRDNDDKKTRTVGVQAIILAPTKELATQIHSVCSTLGSYTDILFELAVGGGKFFKPSQKPTLLIGTPGRILDLLERKFFSREIISLLVLDEADEMLSNNFEEQVTKIIRTIPSQAQICMFSATLTREVISLSTSFMRDPKIIKLAQEEITLDGISQYYLHCDKEAYKFDALCEIYDKLTFGQTFIYVNSRTWGEKLKQMLEREKFVVSFMHSGLSTIERSNLMYDFSQGRARIMLSTDLLARGIDVQQVSVVINYDLPQSKETYIHRIGRSGRYGRKGVAINLVSDRDVWAIEELETFYSTRISKIVSLEDFKL